MHEGYQFHEEMNRFVKNHISFYKRCTLETDIIPFIHSENHVQDEVEIDDMSTVMLSKSLHVIVNIPSHRNYRPLDFYIDLEDISSREIIENLYFFLRDKDLFELHLDSASDANIARDHLKEFFSRYEDFGSARHLYFQIPQQKKGE